MQKWRFCSEPVECAFDDARAGGAESSSMPGIMPLKGRDASFPVCPAGRVSVGFRGTKASTKGCPERQGARAFSQARIIS